MKKTHIARGLVILLLASVCIFGFISFKKTDSAKSNSTAIQFIDPEEMVRGQYYIIWDHGSGIFKVQFDRLDKGVIYSYFSIRPSQSRYAVDDPITVVDAGNISAASAAEIAHVQRCISAGSYVP